MSSIRHDSDGRIAAGRPSVALGEVLEPILSHEQDDFPVLCQRERGPNRGGRDAKETTEQTTRIRPSNPPPMYMRFSLFLTIPTDYWITQTSTSLVRDRK